VEKVHYQRVGDEAVVYATETKLAHLMNTPMREIFDDHKDFTAEDLAKRLYPELETDQGLLLVEEALAELADASLISSHEPLSSRGNSRRDFLAGLGKLAVAIPILTPFLMPEPAAAQSSPVVCATNTFVGVTPGRENPDPGGGGAATPVINVPIVQTICIPSGGGFTISIVATDDNPALAGNPNGLEFDEDVTFSVVSPNGNVNAVDYGSFQDCGPNPQVVVNDGDASFNITPLFQTGTGGIVEPGDYTLTITQCNSQGRSAVRGFNFVVS
jgi:hypothetical protein